VVVFHPVSNTSPAAVDLSGQQELATRLVEALERIIRGKTAELRKVVTCLLSPGHLLIEDLPGLGKTTLAKTVSRLIRGADSQGIEFRRIQFTPDLLPYDITGVDIFDPEKRDFVFSPGPVFGNIILADEVNRSTPKVQSALLEVMAERQVTVGNRTHGLDELFFVVATQNPIEIHGTYPLPIAQLDRFLMRLTLGYPSPEEELKILTEDPSELILPSLQPVCTREDVLAAQRSVDSVYCDEKLLKAAIDIAGATRNTTKLKYGVSPRGTLMLLRVARAYALVHGRDYVIDQDILEIAEPVLAHRVVPREPDTDTRDVIRKIAQARLQTLHR
jgi:MoxR-like ATPase